MTKIGPVQLVAWGFGPDATFEGRIMAELVKLEQQGTIRILDLLFVQKDAESGDLLALDAQGEELGGIAGALLGFAFDGEGGSRPSETSESDHAFGLTKEQIEEVADALEPGHSAGVLLVEHVWARDFSAAMRDAGGVPLAEGFLTPEAIAEVAPELAGMAEALDEIGAEDASA
jgi:hypothetical protein